MLKCKKMPTFALIVVLSSICSCRYSDSEQTDPWIDVIRPKNRDSKLLKIIWTDNAPFLEPCLSTYIVFRSESEKDAEPDFEAEGGIQAVGAHDPTIALKLVPNVDGIVRIPMLCDDELVKRTLRIHTPKGVDFLLVIDRSTGAEYRVPIEFRR